MELDDEIYDSEEEENDEKTTKLDEEHISCDHSSFISDKYMEDVNAPTIANKFSDMVLEFETKPVAEIINPDSEQAFYVEDEIYLSDDEFEDDDDDNLLQDQLISEEDMQFWNEIRSMKIDSRQTVYILKTNTGIFCKCELERKISFILKLQFKLEKISVTNKSL